MQEVWRKVVTEEGVYENYKVSNLGRVKSLYDGRHKIYREKILSPGKDKKGYLRVKLCKNGKAKNYSIHRLVAYAFIPNVMNYKCIDHRDTNKENNTVSNLVWCTYKQNNNNELTKKKIGVASKGRHHTEETKKKISEAGKGRHHTRETKKKIGEVSSKKVICLETGEVFASTRETSRQLNINDSSIPKVCNRKYKQAGKLTFRYLDQVLFYN